MVLLYLRFFQCCLKNMSFAHASKQTSPMCRHEWLFVLFHLIVINKTELYNGTKPITINKITQYNYKDIGIVAQEKILLTYRTTVTTMRMGEPFSSLKKTTC